LLGKRTTVKRGREKGKEGIAKRARRYLACLLLGSLAGTYLC
jgi:hypothetical protein